MHKKTIKKHATTVAFLSFALSALAAVRTLPTPPEATTPDTERSQCQYCGDWPGLGRRVKLTLSADFTPSNCVQVALGQDANGDGDLAPEETRLVLGVDCGEPFVRGESKFRVEVERRNLSTYSAGQPEQEANHHCLTSTLDFDFSFKQPSAVSNRVDFVKVTKRGRGEFDAEIVVEIIRRGSALILR